MKIIKVCVLIVIAIAVVAIWACCKMSGDCDRREKNDDNSLVMAAIPAITALGSVTMAGLRWLECALSPSKKRGRKNDTA